MNTVQITGACRSSSVDTFEVTTRNMLVLLTRATSILHLHVSGARAHILAKCNQRLIKMQSEQRTIKYKNYTI